MQYVYLSADGSHIDNSICILVLSNPNTLDARPHIGERFAMDRICAQLDSSELVPELQTHRLRPSVRNFSGISSPFDGFPWPLSHSFLTIAELLYANAGSVDNVSTVPSPHCPGDDKM
jgi:hypothetical protein